MFIGYLKKGFENALDELIRTNTLFDLELLKKTYQVFPEYCFAAYENSKIIGVISAYSFNNHLYINVNLIYFHRCLFVLLTHLNQYK